MEYETVGVYRHPAQLYESLTYLIIGIIMFIILKKYQLNLRHGSLLAFFFISAFLGRFILEYFKENQINNLGQLLSIPFVVFGVYLFFRNIKKNPFIS